MAIKRYIADADNTITNAFEETLTFESTGSNMGRADILEVFSISAQANTSSAELSRVLVQFPISQIQTDRDNGIIPASGSVNFFLCLYNAEHTRTLPSDFVLDAIAISGSWQEGTGLDMENYTDKTYDNIGSNWVNANNNFVSASATITALSKTAGQANTRKLLIADSDENSVNFNINNSISTSTATEIAFGNANSNATQFATNIITAVNLAQAAGTLNVTGSSDGATVTLTQLAEGVAGNSAADVSGTGVSDSIVTVVRQFGGGSGKWATTGGDFYTDSSSSFSQTFSEGDEDLKIDITTLVEQWTSGGNLGNKDNNGLIIKLSSSFEASSSTNVGGSTKSYYTKKFFARGSEFFFKRPAIEARWDDTRKDNRANFYFSSSLAPLTNNLNELFLYNYIKGRLQDIRGDETQLPSVELYFASGTVPEGSPRGFKNSSNTTVTSINATRVSKGIYKASMAVTAGAVTSTYPYLVDVWSYGGSQVHTGSYIVPIKFDLSDFNPNGRYVITMPNLKAHYIRGQTERFRLYIRNKNWSPNIHTRASNKVENLMIESASYQVIRYTDQKIVIPYGTSSAVNHYSMLSYDVSGNYFDFDMDLLEGGYTYAFQFSFYEDSVSSYRKQPHFFKFRVENDEY
tara:strand:- start:6456 stop:8354 length:1899 start_codon:yes stop_codon:yes gene_type:complete